MSNPVQNSLQVQTSWLRDDLYEFYHRKEPYPFRYLRYPKHIFSKEALDTVFRELEKRNLGFMDVSPYIGYEPCNNNLTEKCATPRFGCDVNVEWCFSPFSTRYYGRDFGLWMKHNKNKYN